VTNRNFTPFPTLLTERLTLRQLSIDDGQNIFALRSDKEINKYLDRQESKTIEDAIQFISKVNENCKNNHSVYWVITLTETKTFVGTICLFDFSNERSSCEIGYELMTEFQGQGIMKEAAEKVVDYVFQTLQFKKIIACTHNGNQKSTDLLSKLNFVKYTGASNESPDLNMFILTHSK
jgi:[ribosomal protein S5]-alanine N-acetyltransferase